jgi:hypothetical protein
MSQFFKTSTAWIVDFRYDGKPRRWVKLLRPGQDVPALMREQLRLLYGERAALLQVREATSEEESQYLRGEAPGTAFCPTGRPPRADPGA